MKRTSIIVDPHLGLIFCSLLLARCGHLGWPRVNLWLAVGAPEWCFWWPTMGRHVSKESAKSCRRLEERGASCLVSLSGPLGDILEEGSQQRKEDKATRGESPWTTVRDSGELFLGAWAGSFLEGVFHLSETKFWGEERLLAAVEQRRYFESLVRDILGGTTGS